MSSLKRFGLVVLLAACGSSSPSSPDGRGNGSDARQVEAGPIGEDPALYTTVTVHYPVAPGHTITLRGTDTLSWTQDLQGTTDGTTTTFLKETGSQFYEFKPLLDGVWSLGPNYHGFGDTEVWPHFTTTQGQVVTLIDDFHSTILGNDRAIYAYLPPSYDENTTSSFPVLYMHDGQNLWAARPDLAFSVPWNVDTAFDAAANTGVCGGWIAQPYGEAPTTCTGDADCDAGSGCYTFPEAIVIGVANTDQRIYEYTPTTDPTVAGGGGADAYLQMMTSELKPQIDGMLRTLPLPNTTAMAGSSLGGLVSAYAATTVGDTFTRFAAISPSTWWNDDVIIADVEAQGTRPPGQSLYVDSGSGDADGEADTDMLATAYETLGYAAPFYDHVVQPGATHSEVYWAQRFPGAMQVILGAR